MKRSRGTIKAFDVDFAQCSCIGTKHAASGMQVVSVQWKRTDDNKNGRVRFQCQRCKHTWSMDNIHQSGGGIKLDVNHKGEILRRAAIPNFHSTRVNIGGGV